MKPPDDRPDTKTFASTPSEGSAGAAAAEAIRATKATIAAKQPLQKLRADINASEVTAS